MRALLINPWIYDFAAYDLWLKPLGLLRMASVLRMWGWEVDFIDCLNRFHPRLSQFFGKKLPRKDDFGCGQFPKVEVKKPSPISQVKRRYFRYGIPLELFQAQLSLLEKPDLIMIGSTMTYWYPGYFLALKLLKELLPETPSILGGIYPQLCPQHARTFSRVMTLHSGGGISFFQQLLEELGFPAPLEGEAYPTGPAPSSISDDTLYPAFDLLSDRSALVLQTSQGCPFSCSYCSVSILEPELKQRNPKEVVAEIQYYVDRFGTKDFAFYDNALLYNASSHLDRILSLLIKKNISCRFHTPNGLHARFLNEKTACLMKESGFVTLRLSLETSQPERQKRTGGKVENRDLIQALEFLERAGFKRSEIGVYTLLGLPGQTTEEIEADINFIHNLGAAVYLAAYSPIPGTRDYAHLEKEGIIEENMDPLWHNNTIFCLRQKIFSLQTIRDLRKRVSELNHQLT